MPPLACRRSFFLNNLAQTFASFFPSCKTGAQGGPFSEDDVSIAVVCSELRKRSAGGVTHEPLEERQGSGPASPEDAVNMRGRLLAKVRSYKMVPRQKRGARNRHEIMIRRIMMKRSRAVSIAYAFGIVLSAPTIAALHSSAHGQSADLVLCDRLAADPTDPDKPTDVKGTSEIAQSDIATAIKFCKVASAASRRALYQLGRAYAANQQLPDAIGAYRKAVDKGSTSAMVELGVLLATGSGVPKDEAQARKLFERAAEAGNPRGATNLAALSNIGGAPSDPVKARALLSKGAENSAEAQYQLGMMTAEGIGGPKDDVAARALFEKAAAQGHPGALERMGAFTQSGRGGPQDASAAKAYYEKAAALGNEDAKAALKGTSCYAVKDKRGNMVTSFCF
jgi:TPR repeat protein